MILDHLPSQVNSDIMSLTCTEEEEGEGEDFK